MSLSPPSFQLPTHYPDSLCTCGHHESKHGPLSPFGLSAPHGGPCNEDPACPCRRFIWKSFCPPPPDAATPLGPQAISPPKA